MKTSIQKAKASGQSFDEWVKGQPTGFHFTSPETKITKWSTKKSQGRIWFTDNPNVGENVGASGKGKMYEVKFDKNAKWATEEQADKSFTDQLIADGYDGVYHPDSSGEYGNYYEVFNPKVIKTRSQLKSEWDKILPEQSLLTEARKYKSAEEFVKAYNLYHGTSAELEGGKLTFGAGKQLKKGGYMGGHFLTNEPDIAKTFSFNGKVYHASGNLKNKVLDVNKNKKLFEDFIGKKYTIDEGFGREVVEFTKQEFEQMFPNGKADWSTVNIDVTKLIAKKMGKEGIAIPEYAADKYGITYQMFTDNIPVYTKSQLIDIWNKANK
jgi:flagellar motor protein MotB